MLIVVARPADEDHQYGHDKAEYFSSGLEGGLILVAALGIGIAAIERLVHPRPLDQLGFGLALTLVASLINLGVARVLLAAGRRHDSITLEADGHHLMTDVWTSAGVLLGVGAVAMTGWRWLDPTSRWPSPRRSSGPVSTSSSARCSGLMDTALPPAEQDVIHKVLDRYPGIQYHALRTRRSGARRFVSVHLLVPGAWWFSRRTTSPKRSKTRCGSTCGTPPSRRISSRRRSSRVLERPALVERRICNGT